MSLKVEPADIDDLPAIAACVLDAYEGKNHYINAVFPDNTTAQGLQSAIDRCVFMTNLIPTIKWQKVTDATTGEVIGGSMWNICTEAKPPVSELDGPPGTWADEEAKEYAQALYRACKEIEQNFWDENELPLMSLIMMAVVPNHQRHGAGTLMMNDGMKIADDLKAACTIEATDEDRRLYQKSGFVVRQHHILSVPAKFAGQPTISLWFMVRERSGPPEPTA